MLKEVLVAFFRRHFTFEESVDQAATEIGPYRRSNIMTPNEREFHVRLRSACPMPDWEIWPQVSMLALVQTKGDPGNTTSWADFNKIQARRVDWLIAHRGIPLVIVELDDQTHNFYEDMQRDVILKGCGWPVLRYDSRSKPTMQQLNRDIEAACNFRVLA